MREAAENEQMGRYLQELEELSREYSSRFNQAVESEEEIDKKLEQARGRLKELLVESQHTIRRLSRPMTNQSSFEEIVQRSRTRRSQRQQLVEEKEMERDKLLEDVKKVFLNNPTRVLSGTAKAYETSILEAEEQVFGNDGTFALAVKVVFFQAT